MAMPHDAARRRYYNSRRYRATFAQRPYSLPSVYFTAMRIVALMRRNPWRSGFVWRRCVIAARRHIDFDRRDIAVPAQLPRILISPACFLKQAAILVTAFTRVAARGVEDASYLAVF